MVVSARISVDEAAVIGNLNTTVLPWVEFPTPRRFNKVGSRISCRSIVSCRASSGGKAMSMAMIHWFSLSVTNGYGPTG